MEQQVAHQHSWSDKEKKGKELLCDCGERKSVDIPLKNKEGRPCEYCQNKDELQKKADAYIKSFEESDKPHIPFIEELALKLHKHRETLLNWRNKMNDKNEPEHPQFVDTIKRVESFQRLMLLKRTLGRYNPTGAIFQLKANHGLMESEKQIHAGDAKEPLEIIITEARRGVDE